MFSSSTLPKTMAMKTLKCDNEYLVTCQLMSKTTNLQFEENYIDLTNKEFINEQKLNDFVI